MSVVSIQPRAWVEIKPSALHYNLARVKDLAPRSKVMAVIKADGYGHGMERAAAALAHADEFAVTNLVDVARLRAAGISKKINTLSAPFNATDLESLDSNTRLTIFEPDQIVALSSSKVIKPIDVWLKVDTGMGRLGFLPEQAAQAYAQLKAALGVASIGLMTHLANADDPDNEANAAQFEVVRKLQAELDFAQVSVLNSAGVCAFAEQAHDVVRPGVMLYGASPLKNKTAEQLDLKPVMSFKATLISVRDLAAGSKIGYGGVSELVQASRVGIVACGYGDGYPRHAREGTPVLINGVQLPLLGRVSMDMIAVDLGQAPAQIGDTAVLWGEGNPIEAIAEYSDTISYELMCGITARVDKEVLNG